MKKNKKIAVLAIIFMLIVSIVVLATNRLTKAAPPADEYSHKEQLEELQETEIDGDKEDENYEQDIKEQVTNIANRLKEIYKDYIVWDSAGIELDKDELYVFIDIAEYFYDEVMLKYQFAINIIQDVQNYTIQINRIIEKNETDISKIHDILNNPTNNKEELKKRYDILLGFATRMETLNEQQLQLFRKATYKVLDGYEKNNMNDGNHGAEQKNMQIWISQSEDAIIEKGGTPEKIEGIEIENPNFDLSIGTKITSYRGFNNDKVAKTGSSHVVPTTMNIGGKSYSMYCVDHGTSSGSRLRTSNLRGSVKEGDTIITHSASKHSHLSTGSKPNLKKTYFDPPEWEIGTIYDITGADNDKQYAGYILANVGKKRGDPASWTAQQAIWNTELNLGYQGITSPSDDFESDPSAISKSETINKLNFEVLNKVEDIAVNIQLAENKEEVLRYQDELISYINTEKDNADTQDLKDFYNMLLNDPKCGIANMRLWVAEYSGDQIFSNIKANVYQYLMTIENTDTTGSKPLASNTRSEILKKVDQLMDELEEIDMKDGLSLVVSGSLHSEAMLYQEFFDELQKNNGELKVENKTETTEVQINRPDNSYTIGPFKISYYDTAIKRSAETQKRVDFSKITAVKIYDENNNLYKTLSADKLDENGNIIEKGKQEFLISKTAKYLEIDSEYPFPKNNEPFYIYLKSDGYSSAVTNDPSKIRIEIEFDYIAYYKAEMYRTKYGQVQSSYMWEEEKSDDYPDKHTYTTSKGRERSCTIRKYEFKVQDSPRIQEQLVVSESEPIIKQTKISITPNNEQPPPPPSGRPGGGSSHEYKHYDELTMQISGRVFWDQNGGKETLPNGQLDSDELLMKNIEVTLYEYDEKTGKSEIATLVQAKPDENGKTEIRTNPTVTDENGCYVFEGVRPMSKYYVQFTYNGQIYQATTFTDQVDTQPEETLKTKSNARETQKEEERKVQTGITRTTYNARFASIGSSPHNYVSTNSLGYNVSGKTYTQKELMGYKLINKGNGAFGYEKDNSVVQLLDETTTEEVEVDGKKETKKKLVEGVISQKINEYIYGKKAGGKAGTLYDPGENAHGKYPNIKDEIYSAIIAEYESKDPEIKDKLQYIEDIKMTSDTNHAGIVDNQGQTVPNILSKYDYFTASGNTCTFMKGQYYLVDTAGTKIEFVEKMDVKREGRVTITFHSLYAEQNNINFGVNERPETDISLRQDVEKVTLEINGKTHIYDYDTRHVMDEQGDLDNSGTWDIGVRLSDGYFNTEYSRELYKSDYLYKASNYGEQQAAFEKTKSDELEVYVTYKITVRNQSMSIKTRIDEVVQYYDQDYVYIPERSYAVIGRGGSKTVYSNLKTQDHSIYAGDTQMSIDGYDTLYIQGLDGRYLGAGETGYIYVTFRVKKDNRENEDWIRLDETEDGSSKIGVGKENIAEVNGYSTIYVDGKQLPNVGNVGGTAAGIVDRDSTPGNLEEKDVPKDGEINYLGFEDDTDKAPNIRITLYRDHDREIEGTVWEDARSEEEQSAFIADGVRQGNETPINGVTVQLVELMRNGTEYVWREFERGSGTSKTTAPIINKTVGGTQLVSDYDIGDNFAGKYAFKSFVPGTYMVRFIYGDTVKTVLVNSNASGDKNTEQSANITKLVKDLFEGEEGLNAKSYNGQDYKSTTYQEGIGQTGSYDIRENTKYNGDKITQGAVIRTVSPYVDVENQNTSGTYYYNIAESDKRPDVSDAKDIKSDNNSNAPNSRPNATLNSRNEVIDYSDNDMKNHIAEVLASYVERPAYKNIGNNDQLEAYTAEEIKQLIEELINKTKMTAETGVMNIEFEYNTPSTPNQIVDNKLTYKINNVDLGLEERPKSQIEIEKEITNVKVTLSDKSILFDTTQQATNALWHKHKFYDLGYNSNKTLNSSKFGNIENIRNRNSSKFGVVQLSMDEELMHGATIQVSYKITAVNVGETDYNDNQFYYTGKVSNVDNISKTTVNQIVDYVANNLQFYENDNSSWGWKIISKDDLLKDSTPNLANSNLINRKLEKQLEDYNTIITTESVGAELVPSIYKQNINRGEDRIETSLVLTQLISPENEKDDLSYRNIVEVVRTSNTVGRKNQYSVAGNQDPRDNPSELDSDMSETVKILPPFGAIATNYILWISVGLILVVGVGFIVLKVLRKK